MARSSSKAASNGSSARWKVGNWANSASPAACPGNGDKLASRGPAWTLGIALTLTGAAPCHMHLAGRGLRPQQEQLYSRASKCSKVQRVEHIEIRDTKKAGACRGCRPAIRGSPIDNLPPDAQPYNPHEFKDYHSYGSARQRVRPRRRGGPAPRAQREA